MTKSQIVARVSGLTDIGQTRSINQDSLVVADLSLPVGRADGTDPLFDFSEGASVDIEVGPKGWLLAVADGMGGAQAGEVASRMAIDGVWEALAAEWAAGADDSPATLRGRLIEAVTDTNRHIFEASQGDPRLAGMGTTMTAVVVLNDFLYLAQVGDSRAYLVRGQDAVQLSRDQSVTEELVRAGQMTPEEARRSPRRSVLLQAMGTVQDVVADISFQHLRRGDVLVLCSDGLSGPVSEVEIAEAVQSGMDPAGICSGLVDLANARGGPDNITVLVAQFGGAGLDQPSEGDPVGYAAYPLAQT